MTRGAAVTLVEKANSIESLLEMLILKRLDRVLIPVELGDTQLKKHPSRFKTIRKHTPPIIRADYFHFLHKRNASLVPELDKIVRELPKLDL